MPVTSSPIVWIIRIGPEHKVHGDPWAFSCVCTFAGECAFLSAGQGLMTPSIMREIGALLKGMGFNRATWERFKEDGVCVTREWELK